MDNILKKIINGEELIPEEWKQFLLNYHEIKAGITSEILQNFRNKEGFNTYQLISNHIAYDKIKNVKILDIACGNGAISQYCFERISSESSYIGIDISRHQIEMAKTRHARNNIFFKIEDSENLSFEDSQFDYVVCHLALMLLNPIQKTLYQINRVLKTNGFFVAVVNSRNIKDEFFKYTMAQVEKFILSKCPDFGIKNGGNKKTYDKEGIEILLKDYPALSKNLEIFEHELKCRMTPLSFWEFINGTYSVFSLPQKHKDELKEIILKMVKAEKTGENHFEITYPFNLYKIKKT